MQKYVWLTYNKTSPREYYEDLIITMRNSGIAGVMVNNCDDPEVFGLFKASGLEVHYWSITMLNRDPEVEKQHPDWFMIARNERSSLQYPAYVDYYKWLCPSKPEVQKYLKEKIGRILQLNIDGFHLDYIRYPDVFLPSELQKKYGIEQTEIAAEYDYCYCKDCQRNFARISKGNIDVFDNFENDEWLSYRLDAISSLVSEFEKICDQHRKQISAAVFPTPEMAKRAVRQDWGSWNLPMFFPMLYHNFYGEDIGWIAAKIKESVNSSGSDKKIFAGIFMKEIKPSELTSIAEAVKHNGGAGLSFFDAGAISKEQWTAIAGIGS